MINNKKSRAERFALYDCHFMRVAIKEAKKSKESTGCGVCVVKEGKLISKAYNKQHENFDPPVPAEILALRKAGRKLTNKRLEGCMVYCTTEPCIMCLAALSYAKISRLLFGLKMKETYPIKRIIDIADLDKFIRKSPHKFQITGGVLKAECKQLINKQ